MPSTSARPLPDLRSGPRVATAGTRLSSAALCCAFATFAACKSQSTHLREADEAVYAIVEARRAELAGDAQTFSIEPAEGSLRSKLLAGEIGGTVELSLLDCLRIAGETNRSWQDRRESLYLEALNLTLERWRFGWIPEGSLSGNLQDPGAGEHTASGAGALAFSKVLGSGAQILGNVGLSLTRSISSGDAWNVTSDLGLSITQPLLRGFGSEVTLEPLTRAERNVVYAARDYERFRRTLAVQVAERYYRILQQADVLDNERTNFENLSLLRERNEALSKSGRLSDIQLNQAQQDELRAKSRVILAEQRLEGLLDDFKLFLGLPTTSPLSIDRGELERLTAQGAEELTLDEDTVIRIALAERLDLANLRDEIEDTERSVRIAADDLRMGLDVGFDVNATSEDHKPLKYEGASVDWTLDVALDLAIDRLPERNAWRATLIALQAVRRARELVEDQIAADLRDTLRSLIALRTQLEIQTNSFDLAARRVESTRLNFDAGRAETRDLLEAQEAFVTAKNAVTVARIDFELTRLALYRDLEALRVESGALDVDPGLAAKLQQHSAPDPSVEYQPQVQPPVQPPAQLDPVQLDPAQPDQP
jgi:outer membrane protein TolC